MCLQTATAIMWFDAIGVCDDTFGHCTADLDGDQWLFVTMQTTPAGG